jgi:hypothetical protein
LLKRLSLLQHIIFFGESSSIYVLAWERDSKRYNYPLKKPSDIQAQLCYIFKLVFPLLNKNLNILACTWNPDILRSSFVSSISK